MAIVTRGSLILADAVVIAVTWTRLRSSVKEALDVTHGHAVTISRSLLVDGEDNHYSLGSIAG